MHVNIQFTSLALLLSALVSVHAAPFPTNALAARVDHSGYEAGFKRDVTLDLEKRQRGGGAKGSAGAGTGVGAVCFYNFAVGEK